MNWIEPRTGRSFAELAGQYQAAAGGKLEAHARRLGVTVDALRDLGCGIDIKDELVFPMKDAEGRIVGLRVRIASIRAIIDGKPLRYRTAEGGHNGLFIPDNTGNPGTGTLFICEGCTDTAAMLSLGLAAIGRPSAGDGDRLVADYCRRNGIAEAVIVGDNDEPGRIGAERLVESLAKAVPDVRVIYPVKSHKDIREELLSGKLTAKILQERAMQATGPELEGRAPTRPDERPRQTCETSPQYPQKSSRGSFEDFGGSSGGSGPQSLDDWPDLIRLDEPDLPFFPVNGLPEPLAEMALAVARSLEIPVDMPAMIGLAIGGLCLSGRAVVRPLPDWTESPNLYAMIVLDPGERKSQTVRRMIEPLERFETEENERRAAGIRESQQRRTLLEKRIEKLTARAAAEDQLAERQKLEEIIHQSNCDLAELDMIHSIRLLTNDVTPERLAVLLAQNEGRIGIIGAEGDVLDIVGGRYSSDGRSNLGTVLAGYSGDTIRVDRQNREPILVRDPAITICLAIQYDVLKSLKRDKSFRGRGLLARFCYCQPRSMIGERSIHAEPIPESVSSRYSEVVTRLLQHQTVSSGQRILDLTHDALTLLNGFRADVEYRLRKDGGDLSPIADWGSKLPGMAVRIAAIIHAFCLPDDPFGQSIGPDAMESGVRIGEYLIDHAKAAFQCMGGDPEMEQAQKIVRLLPEYVAAGSVSKRELFQRFKHSSCCRTAEDMNRPLEILVQLGYLKPESKDPGKVGRPTGRFLLRPDL